MAAAARGEGREREREGAVLGVVAVREGSGRRGEEVGAAKTGGEWALRRRRHGGKWLRGGGGRTEGDNE